jgi:hypothetical protein
MIHVVVLVTLKPTGRLPESVAVFYRILSIDAADAEADADADADAVIVLLVFA